MKKQKKKRNLKSAFRGNDAYKFFAFKSDARRKSFRSIDRFLKVIYILAFIVFVASIIAACAGFCLWILSYAMIWGILHSVAENPGYKLMVYSFKIIPYSVAIYFIVYILRFVVEWLFLLVERRVLKKDKEANKNYLDVGSVVIKTKIVSMFAMLITVAVLFAMAKIIDWETQAWLSVLLIIPIISFIIFKVYSVKSFSRVQPQIKAIRVESNEKRAEMLEKPEQLNTSKQDEKVQEKNTE